MTRGKRPPIIGSDHAQHGAMFHVVVVCGYDRFSDLPIYAAAVADRLESERPDAVIVSGGFTAPGQRESEAAVIADVLAERLPGLTLVTEERAMTTLDNLVFSRHLASSLFGNVGRFTVFGDETHARKIRVLSRLILGGGATVQAIPRSVPLITRLLEPFSIVFESIAARVPLLQRAMSFVAAWSKGVIAVSLRSVRRASESDAELPRLRFHNFGREVRPAQATPKSKP